MLVIGILCVGVIGPVLSYGLSTWPMVPQSTQTIQDSSPGDVNDAYYYRFTVTYDEQVSAKVACTYENTYVVVKIVTSGVYDAAIAASSTSTGLSGLNFMLSQPAIGTTPTSTSVTSYTTSSTNSYGFVDFGGNSGRISPGSYVLIIYGDNTGTGTDVKFDLQISQEIFGRIWGRIVSTVGWCLIIGFGILAVALYVKKTMEGRS
jgi:hypothetical protein